jgi:hypothetical protein
MAARVTQVAEEILLLPGTPKELVTQVAVEVLVQVGAVAGYYVSGSVPAGIGYYVA